MSRGKNSRIEKEEHRPLYLFSLHGNEGISLCTQSKGPRVNHSLWHLAFYSVSGSECGAVFLLDLTVCDYVIFKHLYNEGFEPQTNEYIRSF